MTPLEAIVHDDSSGLRAWFEYNGVKLWTNGHIMAIGEYPNEKELPKAALLWADMISRAGEVQAELGRCVQEPFGLGRVYRELSAGGVTIWMNESYRQALQCDGITCHITAQKAAITFRRDGDLAGVAMPVEYKWRDQDSVKVEPSDDLVWSRYANAANGWFRQNRSDVSNRLNDKWADLKDELSSARSRRDDLDEEIGGLQLDISNVEREIEALRAAA